MKKKKRKTRPSPPKWFLWEGEPQKVYEKHIKASCKRQRDLQAECKFAEEKCWASDDFQDKKV